MYVFPLTPHPPPKLESIKEYNFVSLSCVFCVLKCISYPSELAKQCERVLIYMCTVQVYVFILQYKVTSRFI